MARGSSTAVKLAAATAAAILCALLLDHGFSSYDDGAYAWVMQQLYQGKVLHLDIPWAHAGYVLWVLLPFEPFLNQDIVHFRYPLPFLAGITALSVMGMLSRAPLPLAIAAALTVPSLGFLQFSSYSASWWAVAATAASIAFVAACPADTSRRAVFYGLAGGLCAGLAFGFRTPNGVAAVIAGIVLFLQAASAPATCGSPWIGRISACILVVAAFGVATLVSRIDQLWFAIPPIALCLASALRVWRRPPSRVAPPWVAYVGGFVVALLPLAIWASVNSAWGPMLRNMFLIPGEVFRDRGDVLPHGFYSMLLSLTEVLAGTLSLPAALLILVSIAMPVALTVSALREPRVSPVMALACVSCIGVLNFPTLLYLCFVWPFAAIAIAAKMKKVGLAAALLLAISAFFAFVVPQGFLPGNSGPLLSPSGITTSRCNLPRCSITADASTLAQFENDVKILREQVEPTVPLLVLPTFANYAYFLPNPSPFTLARPGARTDNLAEAFREEVMTDPALVVAYSTLRGEDYGHLLEGFCPIAQRGSWRFMQKCGATR